MVTIEGLAFPLDVINKNGQGIPFSEADNAIDSLRNAVIRICTRKGPHACDDDGDPLREIGRIADVVREGTNVFAKADILDSIAAQKITDGVWNHGWSIYADVDGFNDGWGQGVKITSLTLVNEPAWEESNWKLAASAEPSTVNEKPHLRFLNSYKISSSVGNTMTEPTITPPTGGGIPADIQSMIDAQKAQIEELTNIKTGLETELGTLKTELGELKTVAASKDAELATRVTMEEAKTIAASEVAKYKEELEKDSAIAKLTAARKESGLETKKEDYVILSASRIEELAADFSKTKLSAAQVPQYPANGGSKSGFTVGRPKADGTWEV